MRQSTETVKRFLDAWGASKGYRNAIREFFTEDCVYENVGLSRTTGPSEAIDFLDGFAQQLGFASLMVDMRAITASGNVVMTERVDHLFDGTGRRLATLRVMGVFELRGDRICGWRDYFDPAALNPS